MLIRLIGVRFSSLVNGVQQLNMFEDTPEMVNLYIAMDRIRKRYGTYAVRKAIGLKKPGEEKEKKTEMEKVKTKEKVWGSDTLESSKFDYGYIIKKAYK